MPSLLVTLVADAAPAVPETVFTWHAQALWQAVLNVTIFGLVGIVLTVLGFKVFDWVLTRVDVERELTENKNMAVAIVAAAVILGVSLVIAASIHG